MTLSRSRDLSRRVRPLGRGGRGPSFRTRFTLTLCVLASLPLAAFGVFIVERMGTAVDDDFRAHVESAVLSVRVLLDRRAEDLADLADAYANWERLPPLLAAREREAIESDILEFQVLRGSADLGVLVDGPETYVGGGSDAALASLERLVREHRGGVVAAPLDDGIYQVAIAPVAGADPETTGARLAFASRLDPAFVDLARRLTGFDVAVHDVRGTLRVASDPAAAVAFATTGEADPGVLRRGDVLGAWIPAVPGTTTDGLAILLTTDASALGALAEVPLFLATALVLVVVLAIGLAIVLGRALNARLDELHQRLADVAAGRATLASVGDVGPPDGRSPRDGLDRLGQAVVDLVEATNRREAVLHDVLATATSLPRDGGSATALDEGLRAARRIFGLRESAVVPSGDMQRRAQVDPADARRVVEASLGALGTGLATLVGRTEDGADWTEGDQALFEIYAALLGSAVRDAASLDRAVRRAERLGRRNRLQREFLRGVSHNLQTPLTTIRLLADDLTSSGDLGEFTMTRVRTIEAEARRLDRLVGQLLTFSRLEAGTMRLDQEAFAVAPLVHRVWANLGSPRELEVVDRSDGIVPVGDRNAVEQILWILLDNAVRYAPEGPVRVRVTPTEVDGTTQVSVAVEDEGPGIPVEERRFLFRRFWRGAAGGTGKAGGAGIGLDIARGLATAMGGSLSFRPSAVRGSTFTLTLPGEVARPA